MPITLLNTLYKLYTAIINTSNVIIIEIIIIIRIIIAITIITIAGPTPS